MYAVIKTGGKQYRVQPGDLLVVEKLDGEPGANVAFAAWPLVYATAFSGFYTALILTLFALFFRPVGFDFRSKVEDPRWRSALPRCRQCP